MSTPVYSFFLGPTQVHVPNIISIRSAVFAQLTDKVNKFISTSEQLHLPEWQ